MIRVIHLTILLDEFYLSLQTVYLIYELPDPVLGRRSESLPLDRSEELGECREVIWSRR